jgi:hypothetical protein
MFATPHLNRKKKLDVVAHACHPSYNRKYKTGGSQSKLALTKNKTRAKRAGGIVQVIEDLLSKCKALSSNHNTAKRKITCIPAELGIHRWK